MLTYVKLLVEFHSYFFAQNCIHAYMIKLVENETHRCIEALLRPVSVCG